jgi:hypothetical protein
MNFLMKAMLKKQLAQLPKEQQEMIIRAIDNNPNFFDQIAKEIKEKTKAGVDKQTAAMSVMMSHKDELQKMIQE